MTLGSRPRPLRALVIRADAEAEAAVAEADTKADALGNDEDMVAKVKARVLAKVAAKKAAKKKKLKEQGLLADDDDEEGDEFAPVAAVPGQAKPKAKKKKTRKYIKPDGTEVELEEEEVHHLNRFYDTIRMRARQGGDAGGTKSDGAGTQ